jgi:two-component system response regulator AtoC
METILIVDDNEDLRFTLSDIIKCEGYKVLEAGEGTKALKQIKSSNPELVLLDMRLPGMDGMKILEEIKKFDSNIIVIMLTAFGDVKGAVKAMRLGAFDYLTKPFDNEELLIIIKKALDTRNLTKEVESLRKQLDEKNLLDEVIGQSPEFSQVLKQAQIIGPTNMTVMIQGESGTGKEIICKLIHKLSLRKSQPLIAIDCGAIPDTLVESELFGHEKGAFTGATTDKKGLFEVANNGTFFLDEIADISIALQAKLLRVLQNKEIIRLGDTQVIKVDVRVITATNKDLKELTSSGKFREDLFYRLNVFPIKLPPLRERRGDIPLLTKHFIRKFTDKDIQISSGALKLLEENPWPGNVRQLENVVQRALILCDTNKLLPEHIVIEDDSDNEIVFNRTLREFEILLLKKRLKEFDGNRTLTAKSLGVSVRWVQLKLKEIDENL